MIALILAHFDDEIFVLDYILQSKDELLVIYLSDSHHPNGTTREIRVNECVKSWKYLGLCTNIVFFGNDQNLSDGRIYQDINENHIMSLDKLMKDYMVTEILSLAYEGGHQDHDLVALVALRLARINSIRHRHFPSYSKGRSGVPLTFEVMKSPEECNCTRSFKSPKLLRFKTSLRIFFIYKSQWRTWLGLSLPILLSCFKTEASLHSCAMKSLKGSQDYLWVSRKKADYLKFIEGTEHLFGEEKGLL